MVVSEKMRTFFRTGSAIRKMFEEGLRLKAQYGPAAVADLSIGSPTFDPPEAFTRALRRAALGPGEHGYMPNAGYPDVRARVAGFLNAHGFFTGADAGHVVMTAGAAGALNVVLKTLLDPGDEVIVPAPFFPEYRYYVDNAGGRLVTVPTTADFDVDVDAVAAAVSARTRVVLLNTPNNPTGRVYPRATLEALAAMLREQESRLGRPVFVVSDEPYRELVFDGHVFASPASLHANSFMCYSWSKSFNVPGERIGYVAVNPALETDDWPLLQGALAMCNRMLGFINAPALMQRVVAGAIDAPVDTTHYARKRARLCAALDAGGYAYARPEGTFYLFPRTPGPEAAFVEAARAERLLVVPGSAFGREGYFRLSFAVPDETVGLACEKLVALARRSPALRHAGPDPVPAAHDHA